jgi:signal transduction histidine kinase
LAKEVTTRRIVEEELQSLNSQLEDRVSERTAELRRALKELETYAHSIAHNLRAPLRGVAGLSDLIEQEESIRLSPDGRRYLNYMREAMHRMDALIHGLLEYARIGREDFRHEPVSLDDAVDEALQGEREELSARRAQVFVDRPLPIILGCRRALADVVAQLVSNATKFVSPERDPIIRIHAEAREGHVVLWVEDNGIGIDPQYQERIFGVFERLHLQEKYAGTGIGLAIVRRSMERMGGSVGVESEPGKGSRFWIQGSGPGPGADPAIHHAGYSGMV